MRKVFLSTFVIVSALLFSGCSTSQSVISLPRPSTTPVSVSTTIPLITPSSSSISPVVLVLLENHSYNQVIGNPDLPYLNSLASSYAVAGEYYANTHPSIGNYFLLTTGYIATNDDRYNGTVNADSIAEELTAVGKTWKSYAEGIPEKGYVGGNTGRYLKRHNPFAYLDFVIASSTQRNNIVPFTEFATDVQQDTLPNFSFVVPDACSDAHDCSLQTADAWLKNNIDPLLQNNAFKQKGLLVIVFDEGKEHDNVHGGGHDAAILVGPQVKHRYMSPTFYQHQNLLRTILEKMGVNHYLGATASTTAMNDLFRLGK